jgi:environmental stress-induced protein Ves
MKVIRYSELAVVPWKNGAGVRRDLAAGEYPDDGKEASPGATWLFSIADLLQDAPFSSYPGVSRWFLPIGGGRLTLMFKAGDSHHPVDLHGASPAHHFWGSDELHMVLHDGPMKALNLMTTGRVPQVTMERVQLQNSSCLHWRPDREGEVRLLLLVSGLCRVSGGDWSCTLNPLDAIADDSKAATGLEVQADSDCDFVRVLVRWS